MNRNRDAQQILKAVKSKKGFMNLDYVEVRHTPYVESARFGRGTDAAVLKTVERFVARAILIRRRPLRGAEVLFL